MNHSYKIVFFFLSLVPYSHGQENLILNGNFEQYWQCPDDWTQIERCKYVYNPCLPPNWQAPQWSSTSDYFNACSSTPFISTPNAGFGFQIPRSKNGYVALIHSQSFGDYKEYIQLSFVKPLEMFSTYRLSIFVSVGDAGGWSAHFLQFKFTDTLKYYTTFLSDVMLPDIIVSNLNITDSSQWLEVSFDYVAKGGEKYVIFGDFNSNSSNDCFYAFQGSDSLVSSPGGGQATFYFDDASLIKTKDAQTITFPNVFTPNGDGVNDIFKLLTGENHTKSITILNRWGNVVYESQDNFTWNGKDNQEKELSDGVYFVKIIGLLENKGKKEHYEGMVHLIR